MMNQRFHRSKIRKKSLYLIYKIAINLYHEAVSNSVGSEFNHYKVF